MAKPKLSEGDITQLLVKLPTELKTKAQVQAKLLKEDLSKVVRRALEAYVGGAEINTEVKMKLEKARLAEMRRVAELKMWTCSWPVGAVRELFADDVESRELPVTAAWVDSVGNLFDEDMLLLGEDGTVDSRVGGGRLNWELTWKPAVEQGWRPSEEELGEKLTRDRWKHVAERMGIKLESAKTDVVGV